MEHGLFTVDATTRRVRGILVPWDEASRVSSTKNAPIRFRKGDVRVPRDQTVVSLNKQHDRYDPIGRAAVLDPTNENGLYAEFDIADTEEGDAWLADHGELIRLSPELRDIIRDQDGSGSATLTGAALVTEGAFASAGLFSIDDTPEPSDAPAPEPEPETPATIKEETVTDTPVATIPGVPAPVAPTPTKKPELTSRGMFALIDKVLGARATTEEASTVAAALRGAREGAFSQRGLFALADITYDDGTTAGVTNPASIIGQPAWLGEVTDGTTYTPKYAGLFGSKTLTALAMSGWRWVTKPTGGTWAGNKAAIPSNTLEVEPVSENAIRWAGGNDIAREHRDFGTPGFFEAYNAAMREDFTRWLDETIVLAEALAGATDVVADDPAALTIGAGWSAVIDGATEIVDAGLVPSAAVVEASVWKSMLKIPKSDVLGYLSAALGFQNGQLESFRLVPSSDLTAGHVLVVSSGAADVYTLPGSPIRAEALNIANGGVDVGFFGYGGFLIKNPAGIVDVAPFPAA